MLSSLRLQRWLWLLPAFCALSLQGQTPGPKADPRQLLIDHTVQLLRDTGQGAAADRFLDGVKRGSFTFGNTGKPNAETNTLTGSIVFSQKFLDSGVVGRDTAPKVIRRIVFDMAATIEHEFRHVDQGWQRWDAAVIKESLGGGNECETEGWSTGFNTYLKIVALYRQRCEALAAKNPGSRELAVAAYELSEACGAFVAYRNSYFEEGFDKAYGPIFVAGFDGGQVPLAKMLTELARINSLAKDWIKASANATGDEKPYQNKAAPPPAPTADLAKSPGKYTGRCTWQNGDISRLVLVVGSKRVEFSYPQLAPVSWDQATGKFAFEDDNGFRFRGQLDGLGNLSGTIHSGPPTDEKQEGIFSAHK